MVECFRKKFILNDEIKSCDEFEEEFLKKGKSLYEVIRIINGVPLFLEDHLERLESSATVTGIELWMNKIEIKNKIQKLCQENNVFEGNVKIIFNCKDEKKTFLVYFIKHNYPTEDMYKNGVSTALYNAERETPNAKVINMNLREASNKIIKEKGVYEVILVDKNSYITEGSRSNIFMIKGNEVYTSPLKNVLPGITRKYILYVCKGLGLQVAEKRIKSSEINELDALFISGTSPKVLPICRIENNRYNPENIIVQQIKKGYDKIIEKYIKEE